MPSPQTLIVISLGGGVQSSVMVLMSVLGEQVKRRARLLNELREAN